MRLLNTRSGEFRSLDSASAAVPYATLSHVWSKHGEQSYQDILAIQHTVHIERASSPDVPEDAVLQRVSPKIRQACARALADGYEYIWIDFCCIDKTSRTEVSDAVNAAFSWYAHSAVCYAYLEDVDPGDNLSIRDSQFRRSRWHTRMWTLLELIAPNDLTFLSREWTPIGTKHELAQLVEDVTGVDSGVLTHDVPLSDVSVARCMSWAAHRAATLKEDEAYALIGLFGVNLPIMYGEGALAFFRLQEEILRIGGDQSIFVWTASTREAVAGTYDDSRHTLLASSPAAFARSRGVRSGVPPNAVVGSGQRDGNALPVYVPTPHGLRTTLPMLSVGPFTRLALLSCMNEEGHRLGLILRKVDGDVYAVGSMAWESTCARYRSSLRCIPWETASRRRYTDSDMDSDSDYDSDENEDAPLFDQHFTRVVRLTRAYTGTIPLHTVQIAHRSLPSTPPPSYEAPSWHSDMTLQQSLRVTSDDLVYVDPLDGSSWGFVRRCLSGALDACMCLSVLAIALVVIAVSMFLMAVLYVYFGGPGGLTADKVSTLGSVANAVLNGVTRVM
ncbi:heterokaryon incompatibility protein-domain-containing protein [Earliella scabrosa]|nr:heterokaryon incompatibility protein-domain-containing protein [Earliella scabrosa]